MKRGQHGHWGDKKIRVAGSGLIYGTHDLWCPICAKNDIVNKLLKILNTHTHTHRQLECTVSPVSWQIFTSQALTISHPCQPQTAWATVYAFSGANFAFPVCESVCVCMHMCVCYVVSQCRTHKWGWITAVGVWGGFKQRETVWKAWPVAFTGKLCNAWGLHKTSVFS